MENVPLRRLTTFLKLTLIPCAANYTFAQKEEQPEEDSSVAARLERLQRQFEQYGIRRSVEAVIVVHVRNHPHVLLLQIANSFFKLYARTIIEFNDLYFCS
jgi:cleavage and polyadenylation specificity factor subunit 5